MRRFCATRKRPPAGGPIESDASRDAIPFAFQASAATPGAAQQRHPTQSISRQGPPGTPSLRVADAAGLRVRRPGRQKNIANKKHYVSAHGSVDNLVIPEPPRELQLTLRAKF